MLLDHYPYVLKVDDLEIRLKLRRLSVDEHAEFTKWQEREARALLRLQKMRERLIAKGEDGTPTETATELRIRLEDENPEASTKYEAALGELETAHAAFMRETFARFVRVEGGQFPGIDEETDGSIVQRYWGARAAALSDVVGSLITANTLGPKGLELFASLSASGPSSIAPSLIPDGAAPAPTAAPVDENGSANPEGATSATTAAPASSGETATSS